MSRSEIDALNATFMKGLETGDAAMVASVYAPDARVMPPGAPVQTGPGIQAFWQGVMDSGVTGAVLKTTALEERDDLAVEEGHFEIHVGSDVVDDGSYVVVHRRMGDGSWRFALDIWNSDRAPATG
ncbi:hypothetical protein GCM10010531_09020 [Blastococcus jejuensis]|uniref:DUF4440 domain-containing protein n=1 Tax=Blastococcus jejuensis TaxID=351224 RepID=A0ABP6NWE4_9ACTN